jgi:hypothetical protein
MTEHCHGWMLCQDRVLISERPCVLELDERGRLHCEQGPAIAYRDGYALYAWHGVVVPERVVREAITVAAIEGESNAEVRRVMLERYGWARYIADCGAQVVDEAPQDHAIAGLRGARLLVKELQGEPEPIVYLEMVNSTPEADGTHRRYLERVDPKAYDGEAGRSCHAAMASRWRYRDETGHLRVTFERWHEYQPKEES